MLIRFSVSNFLSFNAETTLSLEAGKTRKFSDRLFIDRKMKLVKCEALFGPNASGKSNLIEAMRFVQDMVDDGFSLGFSNQYHRLSQENRLQPSTFETEFLCSGKRFCFGFSAVLNSGSLKDEWLFEITSSGRKKYLYTRNVDEEDFSIGSYFKSKDAITKLNIYGEDSVGDSENLFLTIINKGKRKMLNDLPELMLLHDVFNWFVLRLNISVPGETLRGYPYFRDSNLEEIADLLNALGTGITKLRIVDVPLDVVKRRMPEKLFTNIVSDLEKENARARKKNAGVLPSIVARAYKEFYTFEINSDDVISVKTIEFSHESENIFFRLQEESDGTARLLDLVEILFNASNDMIYVIDEIDRCLHPAMTSKVIRLFLELAERRNTQLVMTTHESRLLKENLLRNDEISFAIKSSAGDTTIQSLESYQLRSDKKLYEALFDGTIDALPHFDDKKLAEIITY